MAACACATGHSATCRQRASSIHDEGTCCPTIVDCARRPFEEWPPRRPISLKPWYSPCGAAAARLPRSPKLPANCRACSRTQRRSTPWSFTCRSLHTCSYSWVARRVTRGATVVPAGPPRRTLAAAKACLGSSPDPHPGDVIEGSAELEKFVLAVCQMSVHFALQFFWIVYASLQEHCPKKAGSKRGIYARRAAPQPPPPPPPPPPTTHAPKPRTSASASAVHCLPTRCSPGAHALQVRAHAAAARAVRGLWRERG
eukprot:scaffold12379_cov59-Phaeocystis_antarctica.AAC.3